MISLSGKRVYLACGWMVSRTPWNLTAPRVLFFIHAAPILSFEVVFVNLANEPYPRSGIRLMYDENLKIC
jgi:dolichyl-phosphate-mannose--protein O-mannosyl transferase